MKKPYTGSGDRKPKVLMYYSYGDRVGGPLTYINTIISSGLQEKYDFVTCYQNKAPGGLDVKLLRDMIAAIRKEQPDIVHVHGAQSEGFYGTLAAKLAGCGRTVMTIHGFAHDDTAYRGVKKFLYKYMVEPLSIRLSDRVYCVCEFAAKRPIVLRNAGKRNAGYIHNPVPALRYQEERGAIRTRYGIEADDVVFCIASRVARDKGYDVLIEMVRLLRRQGQRHFKLMIIGSGAYESVIREQLKNEIQDGQVIMVGQTDRVADYLMASDGFIFPSYHENLSIAVLEACSAGLPCIVSDVGGNGEIIRHGETGYVIPTFAAEDYAEAVSRLIDDQALRREMGASAKADIDQRFAVDVLCQRLEKVYADTIDDRKEKK